MEGLHRLGGVVGQVHALCLGHQALQNGPAGLVALDQDGGQQLVHHGLDVAVHGVLVVIDLLGLSQGVQQLLPVVRHIQVGVLHHLVGPDDEQLQHGLVAPGPVEHVDGPHQLAAGGVHLQLGGGGVVQHGLGLGEGLLIEGGH